MKVSEPKFFIRDGQHLVHWECERCGEEYDHEIRPMAGPYHYCPKCNHETRETPREQEIIIAIGHERGVLYWFDEDFPKISMAGLVAKR